MAKVFAWLRPNDLVWNYWVNNYLMGENPPAFDILYWNNDTTRLPAGLHSDFLDLYLTNGLVEGTLDVLGTTVDLGKVTCDTFVVAGHTDHLIPAPAADTPARRSRRPLHDLERRRISGVRMQVQIG
jgi:polyhydroxyalkanoate synthase